MKTYNGKRRYCTIPTWFGLGAWFVKRFNDLCEIHDLAYVSKSGKWQADKTFLSGMYRRGYWWLVPPTFVFLMTIGFIYYYTK